MPQTRRQLLSTVGGAAAIGALAGCADGTNSATSEKGAAVQASFFIFGDLAERVAGDTTTTDTLVPIGQHGHGWEPGPSVRQDIRDAELLFHNMPGFQPWLDNIASGLDADDAETTTVDVSADVDLLEAGVGHDGHEEKEQDDEDDSHDPTGMDPHFWMDPIRVKTAVNTIQTALADADTADSDTDNATALREQLDSLHAEIESIVAAGSKDVLLIAGHDSFGYFADRYGVEVISLTGVGPNDQPSPQDIQRAQQVIETHGLDYICADPLESQQAAEQLVADTDAVEVLPLTAMPGLTERWADNDWGYLGIMESVNLPTLERALDS